MVTTETGIVISARAPGHCNGCGREHGHYPIYKYGVMAGDAVCWLTGLYCCFSCAKVGLARLRTSSNR